MPIVAGVDSSTQSCTVALHDAESGRLLAIGRAPHPATEPPRSEQPATAWWDAFGTALNDACTQASVQPADIAAFSVAAQCHGLVLTDGEGAPLRPVKLWNDTTSAPQAKRLREELGTEEWVRAVGSAPTAAFTVTKLAWVREHEGALLRRAQRVSVPHDYLTRKLSGRHVTDRSDASGTGYYAAHESRWRIDLLERFVDDSIDWAALLPEVLGPDQAAGLADAAAASALGLSRQALVGPGAGDQHAGAAGLGLCNGDIAFSLGTSGVVLTPTSNPVFDPIGDVNGVSDVTGGYLPLVCTLNATKVTDTMARWLGVSLPELGSLALAANDGPGGPVFLSYLDGERSPDLPDATGTLAGLTNATNREDLARAAFEGVILGLVRGYERIRSLGAPCDGTVVMMGGGTRGDAYRQLLADLLGREVEVRDAEEATARGAAIQAAAVLTGARVADVRDAWTPPVIDRHSPRGSARAEWITERYTELAAQAAEA